MGACISVSEITVQYIVCVCVCVRERARERAIVSGCLCMVQFVCTIILHYITFSYAVEAFARGNVLYTQAL